MICPEKIFASINPSSDESVTSVVWKIPSDLPYLNGHFPQSPIFPAVGIVDASTYLLQRVLKRPDLKAISIPAAKFLSPITPQQVVRIEWRLFSENQWLIEWKEESSARLLATLRIQI